MSNLAQHFDQEHFADHDDSVEHTQYDVTVAGIEVGQSIADHDTTAEIVATLESILDDIEGTSQLTRMDRVFIGHSFQSVHQRIGLVIRTPSMEANDEDGRQISMEGLAQGIAKIWEGMVALIRKILRGIRDFFLLIFGFGKRKEKKIKFQLEKAKEGGNDAAISKLAEKNLLKHLKDVSSVQRVLDNLATTPLGKEKPEQLVLLTPAAAHVVVRSSDGPVDSSRPMTVDGQDIVAMRKKDVKAVSELQIGHAKHALITAMAANGQRTFRDTAKDHVLISHDDVNEMVWDTAFRGKEGRSQGKLLAAELMKIALKAEKVFTSGVAYDGTKSNAIRHLAEQTKTERAEVYKIFRSFVGTDDTMPCGSALVKVGEHNPNLMQLAAFSSIPVSSSQISKQLKIRFPQYGEVSKASAGIVTVTLLSNFNGSIDDALTKFDKVLEVYERIQAWAISSKASPSVQRQVAAVIRWMNDEPVKYFTSYIRAVGIMETTVMEWGDHITHPLSKLADSKKMMSELA
jgi:hypothetical protein